VIGTALGHYRIVEKIGEGGMGEVYRAHDERLDRDVAIKVLPEAVASDPDRLARFEREAKLLASLNHPNIATVHGLEEEKSLRFLVMELVGGESLAGVVARGPIPFDETLPIALQIARALESAHEHGIIHRDLKPANVMVSPEGKVKVLDFGLAKAFELKGSAQQSPESVAESPTISAHMTREGVVLGTAAYMSPEQACGKAADRRADIWGFGCVFYEMLTKVRPFPGRTSTETFAAILKDEPDWDSLPAGTPVSMRRLLRLCLTKNPQNRLHDIADVRIEIEAFADPGDLEMEALPVVERSGAWHRSVPWIVTAGVIAVTATTLLFDGRQSTDASQPLVRRMTIVLPDSEAVALAESAPLGVGRPSVALSPDGKLLVYVARSNEGSHLRLRPMDSFGSDPIPGTDGAFHPFFSPDGRWVAFFTETKLKKAAIPGGQVVTLCEARNPVGGSWDPGGWVYFAVDWGREIKRVTAEGGTPESVRTSGYWPRVLPDRKTLMVTRGDRLAPSIEIEPLGGGESRRIIDRGGDARYLATGHLVFARTGQLLAAPFDLQRLEVTGPAVPVIDGVRTEVRDGVQASFSADGMVAFVAGSPGSEIRPAWVDRLGNVEPLWFPSGAYAGPRVSPGGDRVAVVLAEINPEIWVFDFLRKTQVRITADGNHLYPLWSPDGLWVIYQKAGSGVFRRRSNGTGEEELVTEIDVSPLSVTPDGESLLAVNSNQDLWSVPLAGPSHGGTIIARATPVSRLSRLSPDGRWMALTSDETGRYEVYVQPYPSTGEKWMISTSGGEEPIWSMTGDEIFYRYGKRWVAVSIDTTDGFSAGPATMLFEGDFANAPGYSYDVEPKGGRFLVFQRMEAAPPTQINIIENWFEELKRLAPTE
jgi:serine/threonine protein kinase